MVCVQLTKSMGNPSHPNNHDVFRQRAGWISTKLILKLFFHSHFRQHKISPCGGSGSLFCSTGGQLECPGTLHNSFQQCRRPFKLVTLSGWKLQLNLAFQTQQHIMRNEEEGSTLHSKSISSHLHGYGVFFSFYPCVFPSLCSHTSSAANDSVCLQRRKANRNQAEFEPLWDCFTH